MSMWFRTVTSCCPSGPPSPPIRVIRIFTSVSAEPRSPTAPAGLGLSVGGVILYLLTKFETLRREDITNKTKILQIVFPLLLVVVLANIGDNIAYRHGLHFRCQEVYPYRNQK